MSIDAFTFAGEITIENMEDIAQAMRERLTGRTYTLTAENETYRMKPEVRKRQNLKPGHYGDKTVITWKDEDKGYGSIRFIDTYGSYCINVEHSLTSKKSFIRFTEEQIVIDQWIPHFIRWALRLDAPMSTVEEVVQRLEQGIELRHEVPHESLDVVIYPPDKEGEKERPSAWIRIGGVGGASLAFDFEDNEAAAYFFLGFQGITEVVEM